MLNDRFCGFAKTHIPLVRRAVTILIVAAVTLRFERSHRLEYIRLGGDALARFVARPGILVPLEQAFRILTGQIRPLQSRGFRLAGRNEQHVAVAEQRFGSGAVDDRAAVDLRRHAKRDPTGKVRLDQAGDDIHAGTLCRQNQVNADRARLLRKHGNRRLNLALHRHHEVGHLVDHDDDIRENAARIRPVFEGDLEISRLLHRRAHAVGVLLHPTVEFLQVAAGVRLEQPVAVLHLHHRPLEHRGRVTVVGNHLVTQMRERVIDAQFDHFRIDHQES